MLGDRLRDIMEKKNVSQRELAAWLGMDASQINGIVNEKNNTGYKTLGRIAEALGVPLHVLLMDETDDKILAASNLQNIPDELVKKLADERKINWLLFGSDLADMELSQEEIRIVLEAHKDVQKQLKKKAIG